MDSTSRKASSRRGRPFSRSLQENGILTRTAHIRRWNRYLLSLCVLLLAETSQETQAPRRPHPTTHGEPLVTEGISLPRWMTGSLEPHDRTLPDLGQHEHEVSVLALAL